MWPMILAALGSAVVNNINNNSVKKKQNQLANENFGYANARNAKAIEAMNQYLARLEPDAKTQERAQIREDLGQRLDESVGAVRKFSPEEVIAGKVTDGYTKRVAGNKASNAERVNRAIEQLKVMGTQQDEALADATQFGRAGITIGGERDAINNVGGAYQNAISKVTPNPMLTMLSQALQGYALGQAMGGGATTPKVTPVPGLADGRPMSSLGLGYTAPAGSSLSKPFVKTPSGFSLG